jgi:hypothetical protein
LTKTKRIYFVILEAVFGFGFGVLANYISSFFYQDEPILSAFVSFIATPLSLVLGIGLIGFVYLKQIGRIRDLAISILLSFLWFVFFVIVYSGIEGYMPYYLKIISLLLPIGGAVAGFNYRTWHIIGSDISK